MSYGARYLAGRVRRSRTIPDQEGTEIARNRARSCRSNQAAERSPIRRGLKSISRSHGISPRCRAAERSPIRRGLKFVNPAGRFELEAQAAERSPIRRGLKLRGWASVTSSLNRSRTIPDQEGTEIQGCAVSARAVRPGSRTIPDQEGTEMRPSWRKSSRCGGRSRTIPDQEGTEISICLHR